jgi:hypothetical protein
MKPSVSNACGGAALRFFNVYPNTYVVVVNKQGARLWKRQKLPAASTTCVNHKCAYRRWGSGLSMGQLEPANFASDVIKKRFTIGSCGYTRLVHKICEIT